MPAPSPLHMQKAWLSPQDLPFHSRPCTLVYLLMGLFSSSEGVSSFYHFPDLCFTLVNQSPERGYKAAMICTRTNPLSVEMSSTTACLCPRLAVFVSATASAHETSLVTFQHTCSSYTDYPCDPLLSCAGSLVGLLSYMQLKRFSSWGTRCII